MKSTHSKYMLEKTDGFAFRGSEESIALGLPAFRW